MSYLKVIKEKALKALDDSIEHWNKMIKWVKEQDKEKYVCNITMENNIGISWYADSEPLCEVFIDIDSDCPICPLSVVKGFCNEEDGFWKKVNMSETWEEWIENAENFVNVLKEVKEQIEKERVE